MARYYVKMNIDFAGYLEAESEEEAEQLAWTSWGDTMNHDITYDGVVDIVVEEDPEEEEEEDEDE